MSRSWISQWLGVSRLKFPLPRCPSRERLSQHVPQQSEPPLGIGTSRVVSGLQDFATSVGSSPSGAAGTPKPGERPVCGAEVQQYRIRHTVNRVRIEEARDSGRDEGQGAVNVRGAEAIVHAGLRLGHVLRRHRRHPDLAFLRASRRLAARLTGDGCRQRVAWQPPRASQKLPMALTVAITPTVSTCSAPLTPPASPSPLSSRRRRHPLTAHKCLVVRWLWRPRAVSAASRWPTADKPVSCRKFPLESPFSPIL